MHPCRSSADWNPFSFQQTHFTQIFEGSALADDEESLCLVDANSTSITANCKLLTVNCSLITVRLSRSAAGRLHRQAGIHQIILPDDNRSAKVHTTEGVDSVFQRNGRCCMSLRGVRREEFAWANDVAISMPAICNIYPPPAVRYYLWILVLFVVFVILVVFARISHDIFPLPPSSFFCYLKWGNITLKSQQVVTASVITRTP